MTDSNLEHKEQAVLILGMHRSGTSCLTGSLQQLGLHLGEVFVSNPFNRKGNRENEHIMKLNEAVLTYSGGSWRNPPEKLRWTDEMVAERQRILDSFYQSKQALWGFKDPRSLITLTFWLEALPRVKKVGVFRHPVRVASSLSARDASFSLNEGLQLWLKYNQRLLALLEQEAFPLVSFDVEARAYAESVNKVAEHLGLEHINKTNNFFEDGLRKQYHQNIDNIKVPDEINIVYCKLLEFYSK